MINCHIVIEKNICEYGILQGFPSTNERRFFHARNHYCNFLCLRADLRVFFRKSGSTLHRRAFRRKKRRGILPENLRQYLFFLRPCQCGAKSRHNRRGIQSAFPNHRPADSGGKKQPRSQIGDLHEPVFQYARPRQRRYAVRNPRRFASIQRENYPVARCVYPSEHLLRTNHSFYRYGSASGKRNDKSVKNHPPGSDYPGAFLLIWDCYGMVPVPEREEKGRKNQTIEPNIKTLPNQEREGPSSLCPLSYRALSP